MKHYLIDTNVVIDMLTEVLAVDKHVIADALHSGWKDFEDSVQYHCAKANPFISGIITRNVKDFQLSDIEILDSLTFNNN